MSIKENIDNIVKELPDNVKLLAVSKTRSLEEMEEAYDYGLREFAENKVQELVRKEESFHKDVKWHLIGKLQTNKVKYIVGKVDLIHSLSSVKLLNKIEDLYSRENLTANTLIQINIGREESKSGVLLEDLEELIENVEKCNNVKVKGIMVIIPKGDEESNRNYFRKTHEIFSDLGKREFKNITMEILSMGMTHDYKIAVEEGSNMVRVGTGIFGERNYNI
ncbi:YggS family pyridoxal phosphate enzyme [Clostridium baratii]|uniref:Pyridoxal phosphate homeostasis protein n=1 Tax=Clostridium baratii TaxID=1561 RepID=A0A174Q9I7_9CLOT|nr:YggS family pyridoxal phosphate-dependent enzyme [Clostridium baratii]OPF51784.1 YggS family pyridoxal phosphate enzyme [Clostridium baratii]OPF53429.1 YggS family pyridoxal phosphate enzyme [Clostridium baratii]OPF57426.1 YggS family pyridoxal phosphate enzyme [Clostridium baratii]OPF60476.1 YggS family pyridoxal phosphate enzyme [Clostridium baratii]CUP67570.1 alanine racemase domain-containing protein [Clostridium baratii]